MSAILSRAMILPEDELPDAASLIAEGRAMAHRVGVGP